MASGSSNGSSSTTQFLKFQPPNRNVPLPYLGLLERPNLPPNVDELKYKVLVAGQPGVGKTHFISWLAGWEFITAHTATLGIQTTVINCPCKNLIGPQKTYLFQLQMWEIGSKGKKITSGNDLMASCPENVDGIIILLSSGDHGIFEALPRIIAETKSQTKDPKPCFVCAISEQSIEELPAITVQEIEEFERKTIVPIIRIPFMKKAEIQENYWSNHRENVLSFICQQMWQRDQVIVEQGYTDEFEGTESPVLI